MKKLTLLLVMISIATLAYNQSSRRTTSANTNTDRNSRTRTEAQASKRNTSSQVNRSAHTRTNHTSTHASRSHSTNANRHTNTRYAHSNHKHSRTYSTNTHVHHHAPRTYCRTSEYKLRVPSHINVVWTNDMHRHYVHMYPKHRNWHYSYGSRISSIPSYDARFHVGHVRSVYGKVNEVFYYRDTDEYILFVGRYYPNQHFTVVVPGYLARQHSRRPAEYYLHRDVHVTGLISSFEGKPEVLVKRDSQLCMY